MLACVEIAVRVIELPGGPGGYGTELAPVGRGPELLLSWLEGEASFRCGLLDTATGVLSRGVAVRGEVRDAVFDSPDEGWLLSSYALSRVKVEGTRPRILSTIRPSGLGRNQRTLLAVDDAHLAVGAWWSTTTTLLRTSDAAVVRRLKLGSPECVHRTGAIARLFAPHSGAGSISTWRRLPHPVRERCRPRPRP
jgi:hypothetical protein